MFRIRNVRSTDVATQAAVQAYLAANPHPGIRIRPDAQVSEALNSGHALVIYDDASVIHGCSFVYKFASGDRTAIYSEIGTMRITANGHGLQSFLAHLHLAQLYLEEFEATPHPIFAVVAASSASEHVLQESVGFEAWHPPVQLVSLRAAAGTPFAEDKPVLVLPQPSLPRAFSTLRSWHRGGASFRCPKGDDRIGLELGWFEPDILGVLP